MLISKIRLVSVKPLSLSTVRLKMSHSSEDLAVFSEGAATVIITRPHRATPPLNGTFDVEIYGGRAEGSSN